MNHIPITIITKDQSATLAIICKLIAVKNKVPSAHGRPQGENNKARNFVQQWKVTCTLSGTLKVISLRDTQMKYH